MSALVVLPIVLPALMPAAGAAVATVWPAVAAAAAAAVGSLGFAAVRVDGVTEQMTEVEIPVDNTTDVVQGVVLGEDLVFAKDDVMVVFSRTTTGQVTVKVSASGRSEAELRVLGREIVDKLLQQYAYNRLVTELKERSFNVVGEDVEQDGTVRLQVRTFQG